MVNAMIEHQDPNIQIAILTQKVEVLETMVERQTKQVEELVQAWQAASTMVGFIKMLGGIALAGTAILAFFKGWKL